MGLTSCNSNKYEAIFRQKIRTLQANNMRITPATIVSDGVELRNREVDEFGEVAVRHLERSYRKDFSDADIEQIISGYKSGKSTIELAEQFGCNKGTINKLLREHGVEVIKAKAQSKLDAEVAIAMYAEMHTTAEIAERFGVSSLSVIRCLR